MRWFSALNNQRPDQKNEVLLKNMKKYKKYITITVWCKQYIESPERAANIYTIINIIQSTLFLFKWNGIFRNVYF